MGFRYFAAQKAQELNLTGFIRNENDGTVYAEVEGQEDLVNEFLEWCYEGPQGAKIEKVPARESEAKNFTNFEIKY